MKTSPLSLPADVEAGQSVYSPLMLALYDQLVLGLSAHFIWRCPKHLMQEHYNRHLADVHCDLGVGTGYFLDHGRFPIPNPSITLVDLNESSLRVTATRLQRYTPRLLLANVLEPLELPEGTFGSAGMNFLLHCLPGRIEQKGRVLFGHVRRLLRPGGVAFGSTVLARGVPVSPAARALMAAYNRKGIFHNAEDSLEDLREALAGCFDSYELQVQGAVALFTGRIR